MDMLVAEVERLSAAWATLDEQNRDKVLSLVTLEERMTRAVSEVRGAQSQWLRRTLTSDAESQGRQPLLCRYAG